MDRFITRKPKCVGLKETDGSTISEIPSISSNSIVEGSAEDVDEQELPVPLSKKVSKKTTYEIGDYVACKGQGATFLLSLNEKS